MNRGSIVLYKHVDRFSQTCRPLVAGYGSDQPIHRRWLLPCREEYGVVAGGYLTAYLISFYCFG